MRPAFVLAQARLLVQEHCSDVKWDQEQHEPTDVSIQLSVVCSVFRVIACSSHAERLLRYSGSSFVRRLSALVPACSSPPVELVRPIHAIYKFPSRAYCDRWCTLMWGWILIKVSLHWWGSFMAFVLVTELRSSVSRSWVTQLCIICEYHACHPHVISLSPIFTDEHAQAEGRVPGHECPLKPPYHSGMTSFNQFAASRTRIVRVVDVTGLLGRRAVAAYSHR